LRELLRTIGYFDSMLGRSGQRLSAPSNVIHEVNFAAPAAR
jgi:hypothetical protein